MKLNFENKVVLIAGGTGGLGRAVSQAFLAEGARTIVTYRSEPEFASLRKAVGSQSSLLEGRALDVTDEAAVHALIEDIVTRYGHLDVMVNTVGGYAGGIKLWDLQTKTLEQMLTLNLRAGFVLSRAAVLPMLKQKQGAIVNVAAKAAFDHGGGAAAYAASKAAAVAMIDSLAEDLKGTGVRANSILPSIIDTEANRKAMPDANFALWPKPEDIAKVVLFLASDEARVVHGAALPVYGG